MKNLAMIALIFVITVCSCTPFIPVTPVASHQPPLAYLDTISMEKAVVGTEIAFMGHGTSIESNIVGYEWRSSIDGIIGNGADFKTVSLSEGKHAIYFRVQDARGNWSREVFTYINIISPFTQPPVINYFEIKPESVTKGEACVLKWDVDSAQRVEITPGVGDVAASGIRAVYPQHDITYILTATNAAGKVNREAAVSMLSSATGIVELFPVADESGSISQDSKIDSKLYCGVPESPSMWQAFMSFDISMIPHSAKLISVLLDLSSFDKIGNPSKILGQMGVFHVQYSTLDSSKYVSMYPGNAIYTTYSDPIGAFSSEMIMDAVQKQIDEGFPRFQIRVQFYRYTYYSTIGNYIIFAPDYTKLKVEYQK